MFIFPRLFFHAYFSTLIFPRLFRELSMFQWSTMRKAFTNLFMILVLLALRTLSVQAEPDIYTIYDDQSPAIVYSGGWQSAPSGFANAWLTSEHYTNVQNATASLTFTGASITYVYAMHSNRGIANIYIDGVFKEQLSLWISSNTPEWQMAKTYTVSPGTHTITVQNAGTAYIDVDRFIVDTPALTNGTYDNTVSQFGYFGTWGGGNFSNAYSGTDTWSNTSQSGVTFTFMGDTVTYVYTKHPNRGKAKIYIDGINYADVDLSLPTGSAAQWQQSITYTNLPSNFGIIHTIHISVGDPGQAGGTYISADAIVVGYTASTPQCDTSYHQYYCSYVTYVSAPGTRYILNRWYRGRADPTAVSWQLEHVRDQVGSGSNWSTVEQFPGSPSYNNPNVIAYLSTGNPRIRPTNSRVVTRFKFLDCPAGQGCTNWSVDTIRDL
jgi:hypothetical protein